MVIPLREEYLWARLTPSLRLVSDGRDHLERLLILLDYLEWEELRPEQLEVLFLDPDFPPANVTSAKAAAALCLLVVCAANETSWLRLPGKFSDSRASRRRRDS